MNKTHWSYTAIVFTFIAVLLFSRAMNKTVSHDEYQFVASAQLLVSRGLLPYIDYPFLHVPYIVFINSLPVALTDYDFLGVRVLSAIWSFGCAGIMFILTSNILNSFPPLSRQITALITTFIFVTDAIFASTDGRALNLMLPCLLSLSAFAFFRNSQDSIHPHRWLALTGVVCGLATGTRLNHAVFLAIIPTALLLLPKARSLQARLRDILAFSAGAAVSLLPLLAFFINTPERFLYGNRYYIHLNTVYRQAQGFDDAMTLISKADYFKRTILINPIDLLIYLGFILVALTILVRWIRYKDADSIQAMMAVGLGIGLFVTAFTPTPTWPQYFFAPLPFLIISIVYGFNWLAAKSIKASIASMVLVGVLFLISGQIQEIATTLKKLGAPSHWQTIQAHTFAKQLKSIVNEGKILTLAPIFPLEAGLDVYEVFAVGPFSWRTTYWVGKDQRAKLGIISPRELGDLLRADTPSAVLIGLERDEPCTRIDEICIVEKPFLDYALSVGFHRQLLKANFLDRDPIIYTP